MDVAESHRREISKPHKYNATTRRSRIRDVSSRPTTNVSRQPSPSSKRSVSADRRRPATPPSPSAADALTRRNGGRLHEGCLWPSTMRSLSVSFQSDTISIPITKKEKPALSDRTLRHSSNVTHRQQGEAAPRKRSPLRGKNVPDQSENSKPVDSVHSRLIDQHRWPSRIGGRVFLDSSSTSLNKSMDLGPRILKLATPAPAAGMVAMLRRTPTAGDTAMLSAPHEFGRSNSADESSLDKLVSNRLAERFTSATPKVRSLSRPSSPSKSSMFSPPSVSRGASPSRSSRPSTPPRGVSPSKTKVSSTSCQPSNATSVLSFIADFKGKKSAAYIEDAHQLRLLHNRFLQWRFTNAGAEDVLCNQEVTTEITLLNVWNTMLNLWDSVIGKRIKLQQLSLEVKLKSVLYGQMHYLDDWALHERDHIAAFAGAMEDLEASTLRLPVTGGARTNIDSLKAAICSVVDVMQEMGSFICSLLSKVEGVNNLVSELAVVAAQENSMLEECEALLASAAAMQVEEYSLTTQVIQIMQDLGTARSEFWQPRHLLVPD